MATEKLSSEWNDTFSDTLGEFSTIEAGALDLLTHEYCIALLKNLDERFPVPKVLEAFSCFDPAYVSDCRATRSNYGQIRLQVLLDQSAVALVMLNELQLTGLVLLRG